MTTDHSPLPWASTTAIERDDGSFAVEICSGSIAGPLVATVRCRGQENAEFDARFITLTANSHYDLLAACKALVHAFPVDWNGRGQRALKMARAAITKVEGTPN